MKLMVVWMLTFSLMSYKPVPIYKTDAFAQCLRRVYLFHKLEQSCRYVMTKMVERMCRYNALLMVSHHQRPVFLNQCKGLNRKLHHQNKPKQIHHVFRVSSNELFVFHLTHKSSMFLRWTLARYMMVATFTADPTQMWVHISIEFVFNKVPSFSTQSHSIILTINDIASLSGLLLDCLGLGE